MGWKFLCWCYLVMLVELNQDLKKYLINWCYFLVDFIIIYDMKVICRLLLGRILFLEVLMDKGVVELVKNEVCSVFGFLCSILFYLEFIYDVNQ